MASTCSKSECLHMTSEDVGRSRELHEISGYLRLETTLLSIQGLPPPLFSTLEGSGLTIVEAMWGSPGLLLRQSRSLLMKDNIQGSYLWLKPLHTSWKPHFFTYHPYHSYSKLWLFVLAWVHEPTPQLLRFKLTFLNSVDILLLTTL